MYALMMSNACALASSHTPVDLLGSRLRLQVLPASRHTGEGEASYSQVRVSVKLLSSYFQVDKGLSLARGGLRGLEPRSRRALLCCVTVVWANKTWTMMENFVLLLLQTLE